MDTIYRPQFQLALLALAVSGCLHAQESEPLIESIRGPQLYQAYCASCHGKDAKGNGPMAVALKTVPPDLTLYAARHGGKFSLADIRRIISGDVIVGESHGTRPMPIWGPVFSDVRRDQDLGKVRIDNLARYLETLQRSK